MLFAGFGKLRLFFVHQLFFFELSFLLIPSGAAVFIFVGGLHGGVLDVGILDRLGQAFCVNLFGLREFAAGHALRTGAQNPAPAAWFQRLLFEFQVIVVFVFHGGQLFSRGFGLFFALNLFVLETLAGSRESGLVTRRITLGQRSGAALWMTFCCSIRFLGWRL